MVMLPKTLAVVLLLHQVLAEPNCGEICGEYFCKSDQHCDADCFNESECDSECLPCTKSSWCLQGCQGSRSAIVQGCHSVCSDFNGDLSCQKGCQHGLADILNRVNLSLPVFEPPRLIPSSLTSGSLVLSYHLPEPAAAGLDNLPLLTEYSLQSRTVFGSANLSPWRDVQDVEPLSGRGVVEVTGLTAYRRYRFRIAWRVARDPGHVFLSRDSLEIRTLPGEEPPSEPIITSLEQVSTDLQYIQS